MARKKRIRIVDGVTSRERFYGSRKAIAIIDHEGRAIEPGKTGFEFDISGEVARILVNKKSMVQCLTNIAKLPGVTLVIVYRYDIEVHIGVAFDWTQVHQKVIDNLVQYHYAGGDVEILDETSS